MNDERLLRLFLEEPLRESAAAGAHNFINLIVDVAQKSRFRVEFCDTSNASSHSGGYSLSHMKDPPDACGLTFRRVYHYPFWQIDRTNERWRWDVALAPFDPDLAVPEAARFFNFWQSRLFGDATENTDTGGFVYVPLQGRLAQHRSFQSCSPLEMIEYCLEHEAKREILATLHPKEQYSARDLAKLDALQRKHARLTVGMGDMVQHLQSCDYVVTQNSSAAFAGYFFRKPALLFGKIDFHHIAECADVMNLGGNFENAAQMQPAFDKYIWWFWQQNSINAGRDNARAKIAARLKRFRWPVD